MKLCDITPLILTYNEEPNIRRCLERLGWASRIVVMDSGSTDLTLSICHEFPNVEVIYRAFDSFAGQCNAGLKHIETEWILSVDADYRIGEDFASFALTLPEEPNGFRLSFRYCMHGRPLRACLYPPRTALYRKAMAIYHNDGHGHKVMIEGKVADSGAMIDHDDRKPLSRWLDSQRRYAALEADKLSQETSSQGMADRLRKMVWPAAPAVFLYTLFAKGLILDGWAGLFYVLQRTYADLLLSLEMLERQLNPKE